MATAIGVDSNTDATKSEHRCEFILHHQYPHSTLKTLNEHQNNDKKTFFYSMQYQINIVSAYCSCINDNGNHTIHHNIIETIYKYYTIQYFVKILEDQTYLQPIAFAKTLLEKSMYKQILQNDILIPEFAGNRTLKYNQAIHMYSIVQYEFVPHVTLRSITIRMLQTKTEQLNTKYFLKNISGKKITPWKNRKFKLKMLYIFKRVIEIVTHMYTLNLIDLDTSPVNFIFKIAKNGKAEWYEIIPENLFKIDHESVIEFMNGCLYANQMNKPMKPQYTPPELNGDIILNTPYKIIKVEPYIIYQIASVFIMILFGQVCSKGVWYTLCADFVNRTIISQSLGWNPKQDLFPGDLNFLSDCVSLSPSKRPTLRKLLEYVLYSIEVTQNKDKIKASVGNYLPKKDIRKTNNLYGNGYNQNYNVGSNDRRVGIIHQQQQVVNMNGRQTNNYRSNRIIHQQQLVINNNGRHNNNQYNRPRVQRQNNHSVYGQRLGRFHVTTEQTPAYNINNDSDSDSDDDDDDEGGYTNNSH